jgi:hypothetical protein
MTPDDIKDTPLEKLAEQRWGVMDTAPTAILIDNEIERRKRLHQHELDLDLVLRQVRWMKFSVLATVASALLGVILGIFLERNLPPTQTQTPAQSTRQEPIVSPSVHPETSTAEKSVTSEPPSKKAPSKRLDTNLAERPPGQP